MTKRILAWGVLIGTFCIPFIPFIVSKSMFFPYITGKGFTFRILVAPVLALWCALVCLDRSYLPKKGPILWGLVTFVGVVFLADVFGVDAHRSFWSNFERMEGFWTILYLLGLFVSAASVLTKEKKWFTFWNISIIASVAMTVYAFFQVGGVVAISQGGDRVDGTLGNSIYLAVYMLFQVFVSLWLLYKTRGISRWLSAWYVLAVVLQTLTMYYTGTRSTLLGLVVGVFFAAILMAWKGKTDYARLRNAALWFIVAVFVGAGIFLSIRNTPFVGKNPLLNRFAHVSLSDQTVQSRLILWSSIAKNGFLERPILGWGQDNFLVVFGKYYDPRMYQQEPWFDRAHSVFVDWLVAAGILGLLSYLFLYVAALWVLWRKKSTLSLPERIIGTALLFAYAVHNLFVFDNLVSYIFFVMLLGFIDALSASRDADDAVLAQEDTRPLIAEPSVRATVAGVGVAVVCVFGYLTTIPHINASLSLINALRNAGTVQSALKQQPAAVPQLTANAEQYFTAALDDDIGADEARMQLSNVAATFSNLSVATDTQNSFLSRAETELKDMADNDPLNTRATYLYATFEARFGHLQTAQALFKKLLDINPNRQLFLNEYGLAQELSGDLSGGNETFARLAELGPKNQEYVSRYAASLFALHKNADAYVVIATAFGTSTADAVNLSAQRGKTQTFSDANTVIQFEITHAQLIDGGDIQAYIQTIITLANAGHASEALLLIDEAAKLNPDFAAQAPSLKTAIQTGKNLVWTGGQ